MTRKEKLNKIYDINGNWMTIMIGDADERDDAWEEFVEKVDVMNDEELQTEYEAAIDLESRMA